MFSTEEQHSSPSPLTTSSAKIPSIMPLLPERVGMRAHGFSRDVRTPSGATLFSSRHHRHLQPAEPFLEHLSIAPEVSISDEKITRQDIDSKYIYLDHSPFSHATPSLPVPSPEDPIPVIKLEEIQPSPSEVELGNSETQTGDCFRQ